MQEHTRKRLINKERFVIEEQKPICSDDYIKQVYNDLPRWSISLAGLRYREGLTQNQLGEKLGLKQSNISQMETGKRVIGKSIARKLASFFKTDYRIFL